MRIAGLPVWALVLVACVVSPFLIQLWVDAEQRRNKERTRAMLRSFGLALGAASSTRDRGQENESASGTGRAASIESRPDNDPPDDRDPHGARDVRDRDDE